MSNENKKPKSKATLFTLLVCIIAVLSGKPISEVISEVSSAEGTIATEETVSYDYEEDLEDTVTALAEELNTADGTDSTADSTFLDAEEAEAFQESDTAMENENAPGTDYTDTSDAAVTENTDSEEEIAFSEPETEISDHKFRSKKLLNDHYKKHGLEMGFASAEEYVENANRVISSPDVLYKLEEEDNDHVYYLEETNEFVVVSQDGYIRTYFNPSAGIDYFNRQ